MTDNNKDKELSYYAQGNQLGVSVEDAKGNKYTEIFLLEYNFHLT